jgi:hypothetical protein
LNAPEAAGQLEAPVGEVDLPLAGGGVEQELPAAGEDRLQQGDVADQHAAGLQRLEQPLVGVEGEGVGLLDHRLGAQPELVVGGQQAHLAGPEAEQPGGPADPGVGLVGGVQHRPVQPVLEHRPPGRDQAVQLVQQPGQLVGPGPPRRRAVPEPARASTITSTTW